MLATSTILLAEDDSNEALLMRQAFKQVRSLLLQIVSNGEEAIKYLLGKDPYSSREKFPFPCLMLLDLKMPKINGFDFLSWRQKQPLIKRMPVIVLTASDQEIDIAKAYDLGANSYLTKPACFTELTEIVQMFETFWISRNKISMSQT